MFNLPWYAWFNLLAMAPAALILWFVCVAAKYPRYIRSLVLAHVAACALTIVLFWNRLPIAEGQLPYLMLFVTVASGFLYHQVTSLYWLAKGLYARRRKVDTGVEACAGYGNTTGMGAVFLADDCVDLDEHPCGEHGQIEAQAEALISLIRKGSLESKAEALTVATGLDKELEHIDSSGNMLETLCTLAVITLIFGGPLYLSARLAGLLH